MLSLVNPKDKKKLPLQTLMVII